MNLVNKKSILLVFTILSWASISIFAQNKYYPENVFYVNADTEFGPKQYHPKFAGAWIKTSTTTNTMYTKDCPCYNKVTTSSNETKYCLANIENLGSQWKIYKGTCGKTYLDVNKGFGVSHRSYVNANVTIASPWFSVSESAGALVAHWDFTGSHPMTDKQGNFGKLVRMKGAPEADTTGLTLRTGQYLKATGNITLTEKTIYARARVNNINVRGGALVSVDQSDNSDFDGIVMGELEKGKLLAGSGYWCRTKNSDKGKFENGKEVQIAITYHQVNPQTFKITVFMDGSLLYSFENKQGEIKGTACSGNAASKLPSYIDPIILIGTRHLQGNTTNPEGSVSVTMEEVRIYNIPLRPEDARALTHL